MAWMHKGKVTRRERFLAEMDAVIPWARLLTLIEPHYPKAGGGRQPDESTILRFRHLLERHGLSKGIFDAIAGLLEERRLLLRVGTIVDATIIAAPSSTKNATASRDPEMKQTRKGQNWHFGMKLHIGADRRGLVHTVTATNAAAADITEMPALLHGQEREVFGDQAYWKEADRQAYQARGVRYRINRRRNPCAPLSERWRMINRVRSRTRARGEHPFRVVKHLWGFVKTRYRGLAKNLVRAHTMFALANLYQVRYQLRECPNRC
jgi:IS5 family transposase